MNDMRDLVTKLDNINRRLHEINKTLETANDNCRKYMAKNKRYDFTGIGGTDTEPRSTDVCGESPETSDLYNYIFKTLNVKPDEVSIVADDLRELVHAEDEANKKSNPSLKDHLDEYFAFRRGEV